jgi:hypothetical protein
LETVRSVHCCLDISRYLPTACAILAQGSERHMLNIEIVTQITHLGFPAHPQPVAEKILPKKRFKRVSATGAGT